MATDWLVPSLKVIDLPAFCTPLRDNDPGFRPRAHIFVDFKAPWFEITNALLLCVTKPTPSYYAFSQTEPRKSGPFGAV